MTIFWIICIISVASLVKGITGFGFALIALPPLLIWYTPIQIIPILIICNFISSTIIILQKKDAKLVPLQLKPLIISGCVFTIFGVLILKHADANNLIHIISIIFIILTALSFFKLKTALDLPNIAYPFVGAVIGFLAGCTSVSGPPLAIFLNATKVNNQEFREVFSWFNIATSIIAIVGYAIVGLITLTTIKTVALFFPILYMGSFVGKRLNKHIPAKTFKNSTLFITLASCLILLFK